MIKLALFKVHQGDPLGGAIKAVTDAPYTHAALVVDEAHNIICEAYWPEIRFRVLANSELAGIDIFDLSTTWPQYTPLTAAQVAGILEYCRDAVAVHEHYSIKGLFDFLPGVSALIGKVRDDGVTCPVFCSQFCIDALARGASLKLLGTAQSSQIAPGYLPWSLLVFPARPLDPLTQSEQADAVAALEALRTPVGTGGPLGDSGSAPPKLWPPKTPIAPAFGPLLGDDPSYTSPASHPTPASAESAPTPPSPPAQNPPTDPAQRVASGGLPAT